MLCLKFEVKCDGDFTCEATQEVSLNVEDIKIDLNARKVTFDIGYELRQVGWQRKYISGFGVDGEWKDFCPEHKKED